MLFFKLFIIITLFSSQLVYANAYFAVIVSKNSDMQEMTKKDVSRVFLSKTKELPNGQRAITVEPNQKEYQEIFYKEVCGKTQKQLKRYWATVLFTGKGQPPKKMKEIQDIINFVKNNKNAISYVPSSLLVRDDIKVVLEID